MNLFLFEHLCGGGVSGDDLPPELAQMGRAMLTALAEDFARAGVHVAITLDRRIQFDMPGIAVASVDSHLATLAAFDRLASQADCTLIIAPEFDNLLVNWLRRLEHNRRPTLNCDSRTAALCADKLALTDHLARHAIPTPAATRFNPGDTISPPAIIKPRFGAGCERTYLIHSAEQLPTILTDYNDWITQPLAPGLPASCLLIAHHGISRPFPPGQQQITLAPPIGDPSSPSPLRESAGVRVSAPDLPNHLPITNSSLSSPQYDIPDLPRQLSYAGGRLPLPPDLARRAAALATRAVTTIPGAHGFLCVDLVLGQSAADDHVIEINPRVSMSYLGLRALCQTNLAAALLDPAAPIAWSPRTLSFNTTGQITWEPSP